MCTSRRRQRGMGSVELALVAPILALFMVLMFQSLKAAYVMEERLIAARNAAWQAELYQGGQGVGADLGQIDALLPQLQSIAAGGVDNFNPDSLGSAIEIRNVHDQNALSFFQQESSASFSKDYLSAARRALTQAPLSPCILICTLDDEKCCLGCGRTLAQISAWSRMSASEQWAVIDELDARKRAAGGTILAGTGD